MHKCQKGNKQPGSSLQRLESAQFIPPGQARSGDTPISTLGALQEYHTQSVGDSYYSDRDRRAARAPAPLLHDPESSNEANVMLGKLRYARGKTTTTTKKSIKLLWFKKQKEGEGCQAAMFVITVICWLWIISTGKNNLAT